MQSKPSPTPSDYIPSRHTEEHTRQPSTSTNIFQSALENATSNLHAISDASKDIDPSILNKFEQIQNILIDKMKSCCKEQLNTHTATMKVLHDEYFNGFCQKYDEHCRNLADDFDKAMNQKFAEYESKIKIIESKLIHLKNKLSTKIKNTSPKPNITRSTNTSYKNSPMKQRHSFGPTKSYQPSSDNNTIQ